ncbi:uncharacterized protein J8A68_002139 [[Candida] subhashii]|uniref:Hyphally-regulated cell wall protein N-terminal domain-containing protein n=1 Tax=[Candida] subhashii TaxID=561895 RepID=A0A8J5QPR8_9ASCO|nr:uncharacterized protein J8A68_002139 [[Candida] subhashii]KAG7664320.1 hypothetical protein J8A68_002139 [[Candida] subhashii]
MFNFLLLLLPLLLFDSLTVSREVILRGATEIDRNYDVTDITSLVDIYLDQFDIDCLTIFDGGRFFYVSTIPGVHNATSLSISDIANLGTCHIDLSVGQNHFDSVKFNRIANYNTTILKGIQTTDPIQVNNLQNSANGRLYIENTDLTVVNQLYNSGTICLGPESSLTIETDDYTSLQKGWIKLSPRSIVTVPGDILSNFCFPEENGYLSVTSSIPDYITLTNFFGKTNKILLNESSIITEGSLIYDEPYLKLILSGHMTYLFNIGKGYNPLRFVMAHVLGGFEIYYDREAEGALPCPCDCKMPTYTVPGATPTFSTQILQITTTNNHWTTITQEDGTKVTHLATSAAETSLEPVPTTGRT